MSNIVSKASGYYVWRLFFMYDRLRFNNFLKFVAFFLCIVKN